MRRFFYIYFLIGLFAMFAVGQTNKTYDTPVKIVSMPSPVWSDGQDCSQGTIILRIEFLETGEIGRISLVSGLTKSRNEGAIEAAKKIKFEPAKKDGKPVTVFKTIQFSFTFY